MKRRDLTASISALHALLLCAVLGLSACGPGRAPIPPGEIPQAQYPSSEDEQYGQQVLAELTQQYPLDRNDDYINRTRDIVIKLAHAAHADQSPWNVYVLKGDDVVNAAATRGNFVFVWTGMLRTAKSDGELATVLAHELGHVLAGHTQPTPAEEAHEIISNVGGEVVGQIVSGTGYGALAGIASAIVASAYRALAVNPESQRKELEADQIGFFLMADAGYDPEEALELWARMAESGGGGAGVLQFLSTHPASDNRLEALRAMLPEAMARYEKAIGKDRRPPGNAKRTPSQQTSRSAPSRPDAGRDSFSLGRVDLMPYERSGEHKTNEWVVVEPKTRIWPNPREEGDALATLEPGEKVTIVERTGRWYRIVRPSEGFVRGVDISPW